MRTQPQEVIAKLEADNSRLAKEAILLSAMKEGLDEFFEGVRMCLDQINRSDIFFIYVRYGVGDTNI